MPSLTFISTLALAFVSAATVSAQTTPRGRPNHADLYGYPHGRGAPPPGVPRQRITPGGYKDPRPANAGAVCTKNSQCSTGVTNARAVCQADGTCGFSCLGNTVFDGQTCAGNIVSSRCSFDRQCPTSVANATGKCVAGRCSFACNSGFFAQGSTCATADAQCGGQTCPQIPGGYSVCENGACSAKCESHLGFMMYCNADRTVCQCTNTANDALNCGAPGNVCPGGYNGKGKVFCAAGQCGLSCYGFTKITPRDAAPYCSS